MSLPNDPGGFIEADMHLETYAQMVALRNALSSRMQNCSVKESCGVNPEYWDDDSVVCADCRIDHDLIEESKASESA